MPGSRTKNARMLERQKLSTANFVKGNLYHSQGSDFFHETGGKETCEETASMELS